jgi:hypothetical protein
MNKIYIIGLQYYQLILHIIKCLMSHYSILSLFLVFYLFFIYLMKFSVSWISSLKPKLFEVMFKNLICTTKRTQHFSVTKISSLMLFKETIVVCSENHTKHMSSKCRVSDCESRWCIPLPVGFRWLYGIKW